MNEQGGVGTRRYGARVFRHNDGVLQVCQTVMQNGGERYKIDQGRERFVNPGDDTALGAAVREATEGRL